MDHDLLPRVGRRELSLGLQISLDLDDGVKINYGKFGDLLAEVNAVTGGRDDEG